MNTEDRDVYNPYVTDVFLFLLFLPSSFSPSFYIKPQVPVGCLNLDTERERLSK